MKSMKAALYDPYFDVLGGGERHILSILKILQDTGYDIDIFWHEDLSASIKKKLNIDFKTPPHYVTNWRTLKTLNRFQMLGNYDIFLYVTDGSYFFSSAKKNYIFSMVPQRSLYRMSPLNLLKTLNYRYIANSKYTQHWLDQWKIKSEVIYPYLDDTFINSFQPLHEKKPIILSAGRFFRHLHSKRQDITIKFFKELKEMYPEFKKYTLVLAGSLKKEDTSYYNELLKLAENRADIQFKTNISFNELLDLYRQSHYYWHLTGFGINEQEHPEQVEHLGITPLEAMATGSITFAYASGGPKELIRPGANGFLFATKEELFSAMLEIHSDPDRQHMLKQHAHYFVAKYFSYEAFKKRVLKLIHQQ